MLNLPEIRKIAEQVAIEHLSPEAVDHVSSRQSLDSEGRDAIRITITLKPKTAQKLSGDLVLDTLVAIQSKLEGQLDDRLAIVDYDEVGEITEADDVGSNQS